MPARIFVQVKWLKTVAGFGFLAFWLAASNHCRLEQIPGLAFLVCSDHEDTAPRQASDCDTDGCASVENGPYKTEHSQIAVAAPTVILAVFLTRLLDEQISFQPANHGSLEAAPPELPRTWQFSHRTAFPPRAPSLAS